MPQKAAGHRAGRNEAQWKGKGARKIGIFYGAAHLPGLHAELLKRGYRLREVRWLTAWNTREQADGRDADQD